MPYPGMNDDEVFNRVNQWYRLSKPHDCPDNMYLVMKSCWKELYKARPRFKQLVETLRAIYQTALTVEMNEK
jgi:hypothetical protein